MGSKIQTQTNFVRFFGEFKGVRGPDEGVVGKAYKAKTTTTTKPLGFCGVACWVRWALVAPGGWRSLPGRVRALKVSKRLIWRHRVGFERHSAAAEKYEAAYLTPLLRAGDRRALPDFSTDVHEECS